MSQQGILETSITLGEGDNALRPVLQRLCRDLPELVRFTPSQGMSIYVEHYTLADAGVVAFAQALDRIP